MTELIRKLMQDIEQGKSRRQIAYRAGVSDTTIRKILAGRSVTIDVYEKLADNYFHLPKEEVLRMAEILPPMYSHGVLSRDWMLAKIWELLTQLPEGDQALVLAEAIRLNAKYRDEGEQTGS